MWVLEARKDAEKIWYPLVWEENKDASNVIDYDIRPEQTKDISAEINANNMTTTGMATVIPWVNAPKLLEKTSIISEPEIWFISAHLNFRSNWMTAPWSSDFKANYIDEELGNYHFYIDWDFIYAPVDWWYQMEIKRPAAVYAEWNHFYWSTQLEARQWTLDSYFWPSQSTGRWTSTITVALVKGEWLHWHWTILWSRWGDTKTWYIDIYIKRLWWL